MHRARDHIRKLNELSKHKFSFIVMDEIFNSTNPQEGISGAYAIAEKLANFKNSVSIITTHFTYLTNLENNNSFKNYKIPIKRDGDENIVYPYKLKSGVSNQYIALELLRNKGFDNDLVDNAENICKNLNLNSSNVNTITIEKSTNTNSENESNSESETTESNTLNQDNLRTELLSEPEIEESDLEFIEESDNESE